MVTKPITKVVVMVHFVGGYNCRHPSYKVCGGHGLCSIPGGHSQAGQEEGSKLRCR